MSKRGEINPVTGITDGKLRTLLKSNLRPIWRQTSRKVFINSVRHHAENPKTGRQWFVVDCVDCGRVMGCGEKERRTKKDGTLSKKPRSVYEINHIHAIVPLGDIKETLGEHFCDMIYGEQEVLCYKCHKKETAKQTTARSLNK
jgi:hypothetical protein